MSDKSLLKLGEIYGGILNNIPVVSEKTLGTKHQKLGKKPGKGAVEINTSTAGYLGNKDTSGPENADGVEQPTLDVHNKKITDDNAFNIKNLSYGEEDEENLQKSVKVAINNFMAKKSIFDKLFESVMSEETSELQELGIDTEAPEAGELEAPETEVSEDQVTVTLDKATAQKLHDVLMAVLAPEGEAEGEYEAEGETEDAEDYSMDEDEEELGHPLVNAKKVNDGKNNKVGDKNVQPGKGKGGDADYTDEVDGEAAELGHALVNAKKPVNAKTVHGTKTSKVGSSAFAP